VAGWRSVRHRRRDAADAARLRLHDRRRPAARRRQRLPARPLAQHPSSPRHHPRDSRRLVGQELRTPQVHTILDCMLLNEAGIPRRCHRHGHRHRHTRDDPREDVGVLGDFPVHLATGITSGNRSRVSDVSARILARKSLSGPWNASLTALDGLTDRRRDRRINGPRAVVTISRAFVFYMACRERSGKG